MLEILVGRHRLLLAVALAITAISIAPARRLTFDQSIESLYAAQNVRLKDYVEGKSLFGGDEFVFVAYTDPDLFTEAGQDRIEKLANRLAAVPGVAGGSIQSLARVLAISNLPFFKTRRDQLIEFSRGILLGSDNQTTAVVLRLLDQNKSTIPRADSLAKIRDIAAEQPIPAFVVGEPVLVHDMFRYAEEDGEWMGWAASILLILMILFFLRSLRQ